MRCVCQSRLNAAQPPQPLITAFGKPRQHLPATTIKPSVKPRQSPFSLSCGHPLRGGRRDGHFPRKRCRASAKSPMVFAPPIRQALGLTWLTSTSGMCSAHLFFSHKTPLLHCLNFQLMLGLFNFGFLSVSYGHARPIKGLQPLETPPPTPTNMALRGQCFGHLAAKVKPGCQPSNPWSTM